jgi:hypothetical protein
MLKGDKQSAQGRQTSMRWARMGSRLWPREWLEGFRVLLAFIAMDEPDAAARAPSGLDRRNAGDGISLGVVFASLC